MHGTSRSASNRTSTWLAASSAGLVLGMGLTGCGAIESFDKSTADAWAVTYEITVSGEAADALSDVSYLDSPSRGEDSAEVTEQAVATTSGAGKNSESIWTAQSVITAEKDAAIAATPAAGSTATCRILLDGVKEIAAQTGKPGERVECAVTTPAFGEKLNPASAKP
ncbi:hypothetical protein [Glutamicibacter sp. NPDC090743]|uniref:hypothetical protein n=1 Tax=Glutamicibacter sp. NPDC090743 TaxID=3364001 RepID=UPI0038159C19